ncbi:putative G-protein coupled receptor F59B2.13 [Linepithema humile]|uniref:putative G-protein coupled receptor F59B2.13 n=1 Tax=Linepithema humile TaxID=83485 RepID=UPI00351F30B9
MFCENNLGKDYSRISKHELRLRVCNNERDLDESLRSMAEYFIHIISYNNRRRIMMNHSVVNISRIKKFKDLCNEDIVGKHFPITYFIINEFHTFSELIDRIANATETFSNLRKYSLPIFIILGLLGNSLSAIVHFRKNMRSFSFNIYLGALAISDNVYLMLLLIDWILIFYNIHRNINYWIWFRSFLYFSSFIFEFLSVWLIVAFTIERYIVTKYPLLRRAWCTVKRAKIVVLMLMGLAILRCILYTFVISEDLLQEIFKRKMNIYDVYKYLLLDKQKNDSLTRRIIDSIIIFTLPALVIVICNTLIGYHFYKQNRVRKTLITASDSSNERIQISRNKMLQHKITKMLILVSSIFLILKLPGHYFFFIAYYIPEYVNVFVMVTIFDLMNNAHYSINFVLYCATGQTFRKELIRMFTKRTNMRKNRNVMGMYNYKLQIYVQLYFEQNNVFVNNAELKVFQLMLTLLIYRRDYNITSLPEEERSSRNLRNWQKYCSVILF